MNIIDPVTAKILTKLAIQVLTDEEFRKKTIAIAAIPVIIVVVIIGIPFYMLTNPIEAMGLESEEDTALVTDFQNENGYIGEGAVIDVTGDYAESQIPLFLQWDMRWGNYSYGGSGTIASSACGPTSLAMIIVGLTGNTAVNPKVIADWSVTNGHRVEGVGTAWSLFGAAAPVFGLNCTEIGVSQASISQALREGKPVITSMAPGHFTRQGHFIVLRGITESGKILVNDPNSPERSQQEWDVNIVVNEARGAWAFSI